jgi:hypothetical protein
MHWAVLLDSDARLASFDQMPANVTCHDVSPDDDDGIPAQLCTGVLAGTKSVQFSGTSEGLFESWTFDRAAISLPTYGQGTLSDASRRVQEMITTALGGVPTVRDNEAFTLTLDAGQYDPAFQSLSDTQPTVDPSTQSIGRIYWLEHKTISNPQFEVYDQNRADEVTFGIAVYAVFLGIAGAGLVTSLQGIVKTLISRTSATSTTLASSANPSAAGAQVTYTATVSPAPNGGTVTFSDGTATIADCGSAPVDTSTGQAICQMTYTGAGSGLLT